MSDGQKTALFIPGMMAWFLNKCLVEQVVDIKDEEEGHRIQHDVGDIAWFLWRIVGGSLAQWRLAETKPGESWKKFLDTFSR